MLPTFIFRADTPVTDHNRSEKSTGVCLKTIAKCQRTRSSVICLAGDKGSTTSWKKAKRWKSSTNSWTFTRSSTSCLAARSSSTNKLSTGEVFTFFSFLLPSSPSCVLLQFYQRSWDKEPAKILSLDKREWAFLTLDSWVYLFSTGLCIFGAIIEPLCVERTQRIVWFLGSRLDLWLFFQETLKMEHYVFIWNYWNAEILVVQSSNFSWTGYIWKIIDVCRLVINY